MLKPIIFLVLFLINQIQSCNNNQKERSIDPGIYIITNATKFCLTPGKRTTTSDSAFYYFTSNQYTSYKYWFIDTITKNQYIIYNLLSNKVLDADKRYKSDTCIPVMQWYAWEGNNQQWQIKFENANQATLKSIYNGNIIYYDREDTLEPIFQCRNLKDKDSLFTFQKVELQQLTHSYWCVPFNFSNYVQQVSNINKCQTQDSIAYLQYFHSDNDTGNILLLHPKDSNLVKPTKIYTISNLQNPLLKTISDSLKKLNQCSIVKNKFQSQIVQIIPYSKGVQRFQVCNGIINSSLLENELEFWQDIELPNQSILVIYKEIKHSIQNLRSFDAEIDPLVIYPAEISYGRYYIIKLTGQYTYNQLEHFALYFFKHNIQSGNILGINIDKMKQELNVSSFSSDGKIILSDTITQILPRLYMLSLKPIMVQFKFLKTNKKAWRYTSVNYYRKERLF